MQTMIVRHKTSLLAAALTLAAGTVAIAVTAMAADLPVQPQRSHAQSGDNSTLSVERSAATRPSIKPTRKSDNQAAETTSSISWPAGARATLPASTAAISYAHSARATFAKARAAMELGILLLDSAPRTNLSTLEAATASLILELDALERLPQNQSSTSIKDAKASVQDWYQAGLKIIKPPAQGVYELPFPATVEVKANVVGRALDQLIEESEPRSSTRRLGIRLPMQAATAVLASKQSLLPHWPT
jgi:hypothetical protein